MIRNEKVYDDYKKFSLMAKNIRNNEAWQTDFNSRNTARVYQIYQCGRNKGKESFLRREIPIWEKSNLTLEEAGGVFRYWH